MKVTKKVNMTHLLGLSFCILIFWLTSEISAQEKSIKINKTVSPQINYLGGFMLDTATTHEQKKDWVQPSYPEFYQLSKNRWLVVFQTRGFDGVDSERVILYQIRADAPDGQVIKEGVLSPLTSNWKPFPTEDTFYKQQGTPNVFGVPKDALINGRVAPHHNLFVIMWYNVGRLLGKDGQLINPEKSRSKTAPTLRMEYTQVRLNDSDDDLEIVAPRKWLVQKGYEKGPAFTSIKSRIKSVQTFGSAKPFRDDCTEWINVGTMNRGSFAAMLFTYHKEAGLYEWTKTGELANEKGTRLYEPCLNHVGDEWIVSVRTNQRFKEKHPGTCTAWLRSKEPFKGFSQPVHVEVPSTYGPRMSHLCADGVLRIFSGDLSLSPSHEKRNPLFCWDVNPRDFSVSNQRVILDNRKSRLGLSKPMIGFAHLSPLFNGNQQLLGFRVSALNHRQRTKRFPALTKKELAICGSHYSKITYKSKTIQPPWTFQK